MTAERKPAITPLAREAESARTGLAIHSSPRALVRGLEAAGGIFVFVFALQVIKTAAHAVTPLLERFDIAGPANALGSGWLGAYAALSGSPVAAVGTTLLAGGVLDEHETFAVIGGSRMGASFIVLAVGFALYLAGRRSADGLSIGVIALLTTFTTQGPAIALGLLSLHYGWLDALRFTPPPALFDWIDGVYGRPVAFLDGVLPLWLMFCAGLGLLTGSFALFDRALPQLEAGTPGFEKFLRRMDSRWVMFGIGGAVTAMTLSVSISLTLLLPLSLKGYLRREQAIPYVMGANITTFIDTLAGALVLGGASAFTVVLTEMAAVAVVSSVILGLFYAPYSRGILAVAGRVTHSRRNLAVFLAAIVAVPLGLLVF